MCAAERPAPTVWLPLGVEQPVTDEVVQALTLAGAAAGARGGGAAATAEDLARALAAVMTAPQEAAAAAHAAAPAPAAPASGRPAGAACAGGTAAARITPYRDGPYLLRGDFQLADQDGEPIPTTLRTVALCRCGRSQIRPFCDGTHKLIDFRAESGPDRPRGQEPERPDGA